MFKRLLIRLALVIGGLVVSLLLCEIAISAFSLAPEVVYIEKWRMRLSPHPEIGYEPIPNLTGDNFSVQYYGYRGLSNSLGFRDHEHELTKPSGVKRIIVIGDSVAAGLWVDKDEDTFPLQITPLLDKRGVKTETLNFSVCGYNTQQEVETLRLKGLQYSPDIVILQYTLNDRFQDDGNTMGFLAEEEDKQVGPSYGRVHPVIGKSALVRFIVYRVMPHFSERSEEQAKRDPQQFADDRVEEYFIKLKELSEAHNFKVLIALFPDFRSIEVQSPTYPYKHEHEKIELLASSLGFTLLDLLEPMRLCKKRIGDRLIAFDRYHARPPGHHCAANAIADTLIEKGLL